MSIALFLVALAQAAPALPTPPSETVSSIDGLPIGAIPRQDLPAKGCAAYLWTASGTRALVAMAQADPARLRLSVGGAIIDLDRSGQIGAGGFGFAETSMYANTNASTNGSGGTVAKLTMTIETRGSITGGALVPEGILQIDRAGQDSIVVPVAGIIGCA